MFMKSFRAHGHAPLMPRSTDQLNKSADLVARARVRAFLFQSTKISSSRSGRARCNSRDALITPDNGRHSRPAELHFRFKPPSQRRYMLLLHLSLRLSLARTVSGIAIKFYKVSGVDARPRLRRFIKNNALDCLLLTCFSKNNPVDPSF